MQLNIETILFSIGKSIYDIPCCDTRQSKYDFHFILFTVALLNALKIYTCAVHINTENKRLNLCGVNSNKKN